MSDWTQTCWPNLSNSTNTMSGGDEWILYVILVVFFVLLGAFFLALQIFGLAEIVQLVVLLVAGLIQLFSGVYLFEISSRSCFTSTRGVLALMPTLMDLKGNLEITLASRMSTIANTTSQMNTWRGTMCLVRQNLVLIQSQVTVVSIFSVVITWVYLVVSRNQVNLETIGLLLVISLVTGLFSCTLLGSFVTLLISLLSQSGYDPDDTATAIAAAIGDLITTVLIGTLTCYFYSLQPHDSMRNWYIIGAFVFLFPVFLYFSIQNNTSRQTLIYCWPPLIVSTSISLLAGFVFESTNERYKQITLITAVFGGFVGNCNSMVASLIATNFQRIQSSKGDELDRQKIKGWLSVSDVYIKYRWNEKISRTTRSHLVHALVPCQFAYLLLLRTFKGECLVQLTYSFTLLYLLLNLVLMACTTYLTCCLCHVAWRWGMEPDETVIPIITSVADFFGTMLLLGFYSVLNIWDDPNVHVQMPVVQF